MVVIYRDPVWSRSEVCDMEPQSCNAGEVEWCGCIAHVTRWKQTASLLQSQRPQEPGTQSMKSYISTDLEERCLKSSCCQHYEAPDISRKISSLSSQHRIAPRDLWCFLSWCFLIPSLPTLHMYFYYCTSYYTSWPLLTGEPDIGQCSCKDLVSQMAYSVSR